MLPKLFPPVFYQDPLSPDVILRHTPQDWRALGLLNTYRLILAGLFATVYSVDIDIILFTYQNPKLFSWVVGIYLLFAILAMFSVKYRWLSFNLQVMILGLLDILIIGLIMHASGGVNSGLGMLLIVSIAASSMVTEGRTAVFFAAVASLVVLVESVLAGLYFAVKATTFAHAGILGATFFATAFLAHVLARRIRVTQALAHQRGLHVEYLAKLNEMIVARMQPGILVTDSLYRVRLFNQTAARLLKVEDSLEDGQTLHQVDIGLLNLLRNWQRNPQENMQVFRPSDSSIDVLVTFTSLSHAKLTHVLIVLEDATLTSQRAHQLKLAALGRLTASIAHEIRNPLGAISHAAQLLEENEDLPNADQRLIGIILAQSQRVNTIVENVLQLSRQGDVKSVHFNLNTWLQQFIQDVISNQHLQADDIGLKLPDSMLKVCFDPDQLYQVLWNLTENALRYSHNHQPRVLLTVDYHKDAKRPYLDIQDFGPGLSDSVQEHAFEPFFTSEAQGTGLGLYLAKGFCEANQASLQIAHTDASGCCFRIYFALPEETLSL